MFGMDSFNYTSLSFSADPYPDYTAFPTEAPNPCETDWIIYPTTGAGTTDRGQGLSPKTAVGGGLAYADYKYKNKEGVESNKTFMSGWYDDSGNLITDSDKQNEGHGTYHIAHQIILRWLDANKPGATYTEQKTYDEYCSTGGRSDDSTDKLRKTPEGYWTNSPEGYTGPMAVITRMSDFDSKNTSKIIWTDQSKGLDGYNIHHCALLPIFCKTRRRARAAEDPTGYWIDKTECLPNTVINNLGICSDVCIDGYIKDNAGICVEKEITASKSLNSYIIPALLIVGIATVGMVVVK